LLLHAVMEKIMTKKRQPNSIEIIFFLVEERVMFGRLLLMFVFPIACIFASDDGGSGTLSNEETVPPVVQIVTKHAETIQHYDGERLYLKAEKIYHTNAGPALCSDDFAILLSNLSTDRTGYYLSCRSKDDYRFTCPKCGRRWWFSDTWSHLCPVCEIPGE
jgi:hypothetical protein